MRKVKVKVEVELTMILNDGVSVDDIISDMDYDFYERTGNATITDTEILDYEVVDSK